MAASQQISFMNGDARPAAALHACDRDAYALCLAEAGRFDGAPRVSPAATGAAAGALLVGLCTLLTTLAPLIG